MRSSSVSALLEERGGWGAVIYTVMDHGRPVLSAGALPNVLYTVLWTAITEITHFEQRHYSLTHAISLVPHFYIYGYANAK